MIPTYEYHIVTHRPSYFKKLGYTKQFSSPAQSLAYLEECDVIEVDTETTGLGFMFSELWCIQIGACQKGKPLTQRLFIIDLIKENPINIQLYKLILETKICIFQNGGFDLVFFMEHGIIINNVIDTFLAEQILTMGKLQAKRDLGSIVKKYTDITISKEEQKNIAKEGLSSLDNIMYAFNDVKYLKICYERQHRLLEKKKLLKVAIDIEFPFMRVLAYMEWCGIYMVEKDWMEKTREDEWLEWGQLKLLQKFFIETYPALAGDHKEISWSSPKQVADLFEAIGINVLNPKTNKRSVDAKFIEKQKKDYPIIGHYVKYKEYEKTVGTYGRNWFEYIMSDKRIHTKFKQLVSTGRTGSGNVRKGPFPNLQNITNDKVTRACFQGKGANVLIVADYSGQESVLLADMTEEPQMIQFYKKGGADLHSYIAKLLYPEKLKDTPLEDVKELFPDLRGDVKGASFAIAYGGNGHTIAQNLGIPPEQGKKVYKQYLATFPKLKEHFEKTKKEAWDRGYIIVNKKYGRKRYFDNIEERKAYHKNYDWTTYNREKRKNSLLFQNKLKEEVSKMMRFKSAFEREALNTPFQGSAADMAKRAGIYIYSWILKNKRFGKVKIVNFVHDEWVLECNHRVAEKTADIVQLCMEHAGNEMLNHLTIKAKPVITKVWTK